MNSALLTIDDFSSRNTPAMVDYLKHKGITALFFATGKNVEQFYDEAVYALQNGMIVGNHSYSHPHFSAITLEECIAEIEHCERVLDKLYQDSGIERAFRPFRFPYGDKGGHHKDALQQYFREKGFHKVDDTHLTYPWWKENNLHTDIDTLWSFDFEEYRLCQDPSFTRESIWKKIFDRNPAAGAALFADNNRHIILMHAHDETEAVMPGYYQQMIDCLLENGLVFDNPRFL